MYSTQQILEMLSSDNSYTRYSACLWLRDSIYSTPEIINGLRKASQDTNQELAECAKAALEADVHKQMAMKMGIVEQELVVQENVHHEEVVTKKCLSCAATININAIVCPNCGEYIYKVKNPFPNSGQTNVSTKIPHQEISTQKTSENKRGCLFWYFNAWKNFINLKGRARRKEFWIFVFASGLVNISFYFLARYLDYVVLAQSNYEFFSPIYYLYSIVVFIPLWTISVRRLHDVGKSGWLLLLTVLPIIDWWIILLWATDSQPGENQYGPNPKLSSPLTG